MVCHGMSKSTNRCLSINTNKGIYKYCINKDAGEGLSSASLFSPSGSGYGGMRWGSFLFRA